MTKLLTVSAVIVIGLTFYHISKGERGPSQNEVFTQHRQAMRALCTAYENC